MFPNKSDVRVRFHGFFEIKKREEKKSDFPRGLASCSPGTSNDLICLIFCLRKNKLKNIFGTKKSLKLNGEKEGEEEHVQTKQEGFSSY